MSIYITPTVHNPQLPQIQPSTAVSAAARAAALAIVDEIRENKGQVYEKDFTTWQAAQIGLASGQDEDTRAAAGLQFLVGQSVAGRSGTVVVDLAPGEVNTFDDNYLEDEDGTRYCFLAGGLSLDDLDPTTDAALLLAVSFNVDKLAYCPPDPAVTLEGDHYRRLFVKYSADDAWTMVSSFNFETVRTDWASNPLAVLFDAVPAGRVEAVAKDVLTGFFRVPRSAERLAYLESAGWPAVVTPYWLYVLVALPGLVPGAQRPLLKVPADLESAAAPPSLVCGRVAKVGLRDLKEYPVKLDVLPGMPGIWHLDGTVPELADRGGFLELLEPEQQ